MLVFEEITYVIETIAIIAFAISGMMSAKMHNMDPVGIFTVACTTAFGGGTVRDLILNNTEIYWIQHQEYPIVILGLSIIFGYSRKFDWIQDKHIIFPDAVGLGLFTVAGAQMALAMGNSFFISAIIGVMTGTFGGAMRDIIVNDVPMIFRKVNLYASCAFVGCWVYFGMLYVTDNVIFQVSTGVVFIVAARMLAVKYNIRLQKDLTTDTMQ